MSTIADLKSITTIAKIAMMTIDKEAKEINSPYSLDWIKYENENKNYILKYARKDTTDKFNFTIPNIFFNECYCLCLCDEYKKLYIFKLEDIDNKIVIQKDKNNGEFKFKNTSITPFEVINLENFENWLTYQNNEKRIKMLATKARIKNFGEQDVKQKNSAQFESKDEFLKWYTNQPKICCYCGIKQEDLELYFNSENRQYIFSKQEKARQRGRYLEIERIVTLNDKNVYSKENCALACYVCNNAKSDFLSPKSFKPIAKGINEFWNQILLDNNKEKITFKEDDKIWDRE